MRLPRPRRLLRRPLRIPQPQLRPAGPGEPRIFGFNAERDDLIDEVTSRVVSDLAEAGTDFGLVINETALREIDRLEHDPSEDGSGLAFWRGVSRRVGGMSTGQQRESLRDIVSHMTRDIAGNFDQRVYRAAKRVVPAAVAGLMKPGQLLRALSGRSSLGLDRLIRVEGPVERLRTLATHGTIVLVPTHSSNLDSLAIGEALARQGLPPVVYGAGKNLFTNPIVSFFMHNLGAYRIDRRVSAALYKRVLKAWSCALIERGYHSLFFPGGTRSRSGMLESRLKLGLAGTGVEALTRSAVAGRAQAVFFVPVTINYALALEAESLIEDFLRQTGRAHYVTDDDGEFSRVERWLAFFDKLQDWEAPCVLRFSEPMDPFGNPVDDLGRTLAPDGRTIDRLGYVSRGGVPVLDAARDAAYTRALGDHVVEHFRRDTVIMQTWLVAHVLFRRLVRETPGMNLFGRVRRRGLHAVSREDLLAELGRAMERLEGLAQKGEVRIGPGLAQADPNAVLHRAMQAWGGYHTKTIVREEAKGLVISDPALLLYYQNRMVDWAEPLADGPDQAAAREIASMRLGGSFER